ncbi:MAG: hypothetical protein JWR12_528 [Mucilaginibacter sp.]|jgi:hypothetical protein|nr:hypothetical protein [Mucilaginibacter sp.]
MKLKKYSLSFVFALFALSSCTKSKAPNPSPSSTPTPISTNGPDVYVAGFTLTKNTLVATYYKNGVSTRLADSAFSSYAYSISVTNSDIYVAGSSGSTSNGTGVPTYWKNGEPTHAENFGVPSTSQSSLAISGTDIFTAGFVNTNFYPKAAYWKNGIETKLADYSSGSKLNGIAINGSDVWAAGMISVRNYPPSAAYWKNGIVTKLTDSTSSAEVNAITINGNDVYLAGDMASESFYNSPNGPIAGNPVAVYWKNGSVTKLGNTKDYSRALDIVLNGTDVYVGGYIISGGVYNMVYWKNGVMTQFNTSNLTIINATPIANIAVNGADVYVAGGYSGYWKNAIFVQLPQNFSAVAIAVVPH